MPFYLMSSGGGLGKEKTKENIGFVPETCLEKVWNKSHKSEMGHNGLIWKIR